MSDLLDLDSDVSENPTETVLVEIRATLGAIARTLDMVTHTQALQADEIQALSRRCAQAHDLASEARRMSDQARDYADDMVRAMKAHFEVVSRTLSQQGDAITEQSRYIASQTAVLTEHTAILGKQSAELDGQSKALASLTSSEFRRCTREELIERYAREQRDWVRWGIPIVMTLLSTLVAVIYWAASHGR